MLVATTSAHAAGWVSLGTMNVAGSDSLDPSVVIDGTGNITVAWFDDTSDQAKATYRPAGGAPGAVQNLGAASSEPELGVNSNGEVVAIFPQDANTLRYAIKPAGSASFGAAQSISGSYTINTDPVLATDPSGRALVAFVNEGVGPQYAFRPSGGSFGAVATAQADPLVTELTSLDTAISTNGTAYIVWRDSANNVDGIPVNSSGATGTFNGNLGATIPAAEPAVALDANGNPTVGFPSTGGDVSTLRIVNGTPGSVVDLTGLNVVPKNIQVTTTAVGSSHVVWTNTQSVPDVAQARRVTAAGSLGVFQTPLSPETTDALVSDAAGNPDGAVLALWQTQVPAGIQAVAAGNAQPFGAFAQLASTSGVGPTGMLEVDLADNGNGAAAWDNEAATATVSAAGYDNSDPTLSSISNAPTAGTQLKPVSFSATPFDIFALSGPVSWNFGDGKTASGNSVTHTYAKPGTFTVTATASDTVGNSVSSKKSIKVAAGPSAVGVILSKRLKLARNGRISVRLRCGANSVAVCRGTVYLRSAKKVRGASAAARKRLLTIGQRSYSIPQGKTTTVKVTAKKKARRVVRRLKRLRVRVSVTGRTGAGKMTIKRKTLTLRR